MKNNISNILIYIIIFIIASLIILITPLNNIYLSSISLIIFSVFLMFNYFRNNKCFYKRELYILWSLIALLVVIFTFNIVNIIISFLIAILLIIQHRKETLYKSSKVTKNSNKIPEVKLTKTTVNVNLPSTFKEEEFYEIAKKLYTNMQKYFVNFDYEKLKEILNEDIYLQFEKQMKHLEISEKIAIRDNIEIIDFKINKFEDNINNLLITVSMGVLEDKYTIKRDENKRLNCRYETYYEIVYKKSNDWTIHSLNLINSRSKKS